MDINDVIMEMGEASLKDEWLARTAAHIERVKKYGRKIGITGDFNDHDADKLNELADDYCLLLKKNKFGGANIKDSTAGLTDDEVARLNAASFKHITNNPHHPEYWCDIKTFDRSNPPMGLDCYAMPYEALEEMCADWCATAEECGTNTPYEWFKKTVPSRWVFDDHQLEFIDKTLHKMWEE